MGNSHSAWLVIPSGVVDSDYYFVSYSYGNISPFMDSDDVVWTVWLDGGIYGNRPMVDNGSYGFYPHKFKWHYREINSRLGHLWKERRE